MSFRIRGVGERVGVTNEVPKSSPVAIRDGFPEIALKVAEWAHLRRPNDIQVMAENDILCGGAFVLQADCHVGQV